ncbi:hypothetical protein IMY63_26975 (plasmid) [Klebsiella pneumoniae]|uniref:hypothetical protein n=1 Tax=Klebsiella pneumoniae TaxID=573 RepID=UPI0018735AB5|nr:hypothetical protein [Klebsiella pneumoniae]QOR82605.1 hypothetical protein IMY63_26975 [Klebsiella pneumoniae]
MKAENTTGVVWQPFELESYRLRDAFSEQERLALSTPQRRGKYLQQKRVPAFLRPALLQIVGGDKLIIPFC